MDVWANVAILLMYGSHDMRQVFLRLTVVNGTLGIWGVTSWLSHSYMVLSSGTSRILYLGCHIIID